jgi:predicted metalloendopeptidase
MCVSGSVQYTCGAWVANTTLPPSQPLISRTFSAVVDHNNNMSIHILTSPQFANTRMGMCLRIYMFVHMILYSYCFSYCYTARLYRDCMDTDRIDELGVSVLEDSWALFNSMTNLDHVMYVAGVLQSGGIPAFASISVVADPLHPLVSIAEFDQGGFALPDRSLYLDNSTSKLRDDYVQHMIRMFELAGVDDAEKIASEALAVEMELANAALPGDQIRNPADLYHKIDLSGLKSLAPLLNWDIFLKGLIAPAGMTQINVAEPGFFVVLNWFLPSLPVTTLRSYMMWQLLHAMAPYLGSMIVNENYQFFYAELQGQTAPTPRNVTCVNLVNQALGELFYFFLQQPKCFSHTFLDSSVQVMSSARHSSKLHFPAIRTMRLST